MKPIAKGYVISVHRKNFWWRFRLQRGLGVWHDGQSRISKLSNRERRFLQPGAILALLKGGTFRFNRARWSKRDIQHARKYAAVFTKVFEKH